MREGNDLHPSQDQRWQVPLPARGQNRQQYNQAAVRAGGGRAEFHPEGVYYIRYLRDGKRVWEQIGPDPIAALVAVKRRELHAFDPDAKLLGASPEPSTDKSLDECAAEYLAEIEAAKANRTYLAYQLPINGFVNSCRAKTMDTVDRRDVLTYISTVRKTGVSPRTIANRLMYLKTFLLHFGVAWPLLRTDRVQYT